MLLNLAVNARDAMPEGGELMIGVEEVDVAAAYIDERSQLGGMRPGPWLRLSVTDTGEGITEEVFPHIFEPFFTTKQPGKGTGLGLAAVHGCVRNHSGFIDVTSVPGSGTAFNVYLPLRSLAADDDDETGSSPIPSPSRQGARVMIVDDEPITVESLSEWLRTLGHRVDSFTDPVAALEYFRRHYREIDVVVLDMVMPRMSGQEVFEAMRAIKPSVKVLLASGHTGMGDSGVLTIGGYAGFLRKPVGQAEIAGELERALTPGNER
jgi:CheY-like chemotaxis protein